MPPDFPLVALINLSEQSFAVSSLRLRACGFEICFCRPRFRTTRDTIESDRAQNWTEFVDFEQVFQSFWNHFGFILDDMVPGRSLGAILSDFERFWSSFWNHFGFIFDLFSMKKLVRISIMFLSLILIDFEVILGAKSESFWSSEAIRERKREFTKTIDFAAQAQCFRGSTLPKREQIEPESDAKGEFDFDAFSRSESSRF